jgi:hypothetical protein
MFAHALRNLFVREAELFDQPAQPMRFFDGIQVSALQVLDEAEDELLVVVGIASHDGGHSGEAGQARGSPPALAGDQLVAVGKLSHQQWLEDAVQSDRFRKLTQWFRVESRAHLLARWADLVDRDHLRHQSLALG